MKIAIVAPPWIDIPPIGYGGTERVIQNITTGLVRKNHNVTLYATGNSKTSAKLKFYYQNALGNDKSRKLNPFYITAHLNGFYKEANNYDIIHDNSSELAVYYRDFTKTPCVYTLHGSYNVDSNDILAEYNWSESVRSALMQYKSSPFISISAFQRKSLPGLNYVGTIYNSVIIDEFEFNPRGTQEITWLGRFSPVKGLHTAAEIATKLNKHLLVEGALDKGDQSYFETKIKPMAENGTLLITDKIRSEHDKSLFLGESRLFLFPLQWDEPFGIVMVEAMASGTPVVAYAKGSVPEVVKDGETGFIINPSDNDIRGDWIIKQTGTKGLYEAAERIYALPEAKYQAMRFACRAHVEKYFTVNRMVDEYEKVYEHVLSAGR